MTTLVPMSEAAYAAFVGEAIAEYALDNAQAGR